MPLLPPPQIPTLMPPSFLCVISGAFKLYDLDNDGYITRNEMLDIVDAIYQMVVSVLGSHILDGPKFWKNIERLWENTWKSASGFSSALPFHPCATFWTSNDPGVSLRSVSPGATNSHLHDRPPPILNNMHQMIYTMIVLFKNTKL